MTSTEGRARVGEMGGEDLAGLQQHLLNPPSSLKTLQFLNLCFTLENTQNKLPSQYKTRHFFTDGSQFVPIAFFSLCHCKYFLSVTFLNINMQISRK